ncbi:MAG: hypothetical protein U1E70_09200 [Acetobacteraceae bacterium]
MKGLAFDIADLMAVRSWADRNDIRLDIRLDHGVDDEEYEEVIAFSEAGACFLLMWRDQDTVFAQPMPGRQIRFKTVSEALRRLYIKPSEPANS